MRTFSSIWSAIAVVPLLSTPALADLSVFFHVRPPYYTIAESGKIGGLVGTPARQVFDKAGIAVKWSEIPAGRQLREIQVNRKKICAIGWFKKPEREAFAVFSLPIYRDLPLAALARRDNGKVRGHDRIADLFADRTVRFGTKLGYSYGQELDALAAAKQPITVTTTQDNVGMVRMLLRGRFDYFLVAPEESDDLLARVETAKERLMVKKFSDIPGGNSRYIICSQQVDDSTISKINSAITAVIRR